MATSDENVYKILRAGELVDLLLNEAFAGSPDDRRDGFIHLSERLQLDGTLHKHFPEQRGLYLVALDRGVLAAALRMEPSRGGALFPHLHRPLRVADVAWIRPIPDAERAAWCARLSAP